MARKIVLITGASSGIGLELAKVFARNNHDLAIVSRRHDVLTQVAEMLSGEYDVSVTTVAKDLSLPGSTLELFEELTEKNIEVDILVNNAGFGNYGFFSETSRLADLELIQLNITALTDLTKLFLPSMINRGFGRILNVGSIASFMSGPYMNTYFASKAYVLNFSVGLSVELRGTGVGVSCLCPGPTPTNFGTRAHYHFNLNRMHKMSAGKVAQIGYDGCINGKLIIIPGLKWQIATFINRLFSRFRVAVIVKKLSGF
jgi:hypothetical protein